MAIVLVCEVEERASAASADAVRCRQRGAGGGIIKKEASTIEQSSYRMSKLPKRGKSLPTDHIQLANFGSVDAVLRETRT
tara:strand:- start:1045 stop:1284 length:240 start_codon:yes stop_codon:yes gene_type:complete